MDRALSSEMPEGMRRKNVWTNLIKKVSSINLTREMHIKITANDLIKLSNILRYLSFFPHAYIIPYFLGASSTLLSFLQNIAMSALLTTIRSRDLCMF